jgi:hypothetical protein
MWHFRGKIFLTKDPNYIITNVCYFPNINTTYQLYKEDNQVGVIQKDEKYRELMAYYELVSGGHNFIPIYLEDDCPKLGELQKKYPLKRSFYWCIGYVSSYLENGSKSLLQGGHKVNEPSLETLLDWLEYYSSNYVDSIHSCVNQLFANNYLRQYIYLKTKDDEKLSNRRFKLIYNCSTVFDDRELTIKDWINHLKNLSNRDIYEILVNDFK